MLAAFARECLDRMQEESVRSYLEELINAHLVGIANTPRAAKIAGGDDKGRNWEEVG